MAETLVEWECYVDEITDTHVHLVMKDVVDRMDREDQGSFPKRLFDHLTIVRGMYLTVSVRSDETISITPTPEAYGPSAGLYLADLLRRTGFD